MPGVERFHLRSHAGRRPPVARQDAPAARVQLARGPLEVVARRAQRRLDAERDLHARQQQPAKPACAHDQAKLTAKPLATRPVLARQVLTTESPRSEPCPGTHAPAHEQWPDSVMDNLCRVCAHQLVMAVASGGSTWRGRACAAARQRCP